MKENEKQVDKNIYYNFNVYKIVATYIIALLHFGKVEGFAKLSMAIFVEYFFLVSGGVLAKTFVLNRRNISTYIKSRYTRLYPEYILFMILYLAFVFDENHQVGLYWLKTSPLSLLGLQVLGIGDHGHNFGATWYVSVLIVCGTLIYILHFIFEDKTKYLLACIFFVGYLYLFIFNGSVIASWSNSNGPFSNYDVIRGICDLSLGAFLFHTTYKKQKMRGGFLAEFFFFSIGLIVAFMEKSSFISLACLALSVYSGFLNDKSSWYVYNNRYVNNLIDVSYAIYLNHAIFVDFKLIDKFNVGNIYLEVFLYLFLVTVFSVFTHVFATKFYCCISDKVRNLNRWCGNNL